MRVIHCFLTILFPLLAFAGQPPASADAALKKCRGGDKSACVEYVHTAPARHASFWRNAAPLAPAPPGLIEFLEIDNMLDGFKDHPVSAQANPEMLEKIKDAIRGIPPPVSAALSHSLVGIFLVEHLGSTAYHLDLFEDDLSPSRASLIVLDVKAVARAPNAWATWKENTVFSWDPGMEIRFTLENAANNTVTNTVQYILLHEMGHVLERSGNHTPHHWATPEPDLVRAFPFLSLSWGVEGDHYTSQFDSSFPERKLVHFYSQRAEDSIPPSRAVDVYKALSRTSFPSLYAATNPNEDFAESFVGYIHSVLLKRPATVEIRKNNTVLFTLPDCWNLPRCKSKRNFFDRVLKTGDGR